MTTPSRLLVLLACALACLGLNASVTAAPSARPYTMSVKVTHQGSDLVLVVQGTGPRQGAWVGCSMYPRGVKDPINQGSHTAVRVGSTYNKAWHVPAGFPGGTYEVALWTRKIPRAQCKTPNNPWCVRNGYLMEGMLVYRHGNLSTH